MVKKITEESIDEEMVLLDATAHFERSQCNYLVDVSGLRRVSYMGEFAGNAECPSTDAINEARKIKDVQKLSDISVMFEFVNREYTDRLKRVYLQRGRDQW